MPGDLYGEGAGLIQSAGSLTGQTQQRKQDAEANAQAGATGSLKDPMAMARQKQQQEADKKTAELQVEANERMEKLKRKMNYVTLSGPMAIGLAKHSKNPEWLKAVGTEMPADQLLGVYTAETQAAAKQSRPQLKQLQEGDRVYHAYTWIDEDTGQVVTVPVDKGGAKAPGAAVKEDTLTATERSRFIANYDKNAKALSELQKKRGYAAGDEAKQIDTQISTLNQQLSDDRPKYDQLKGKQAKGGGFNSSEATPPPSSDDIDKILDAAAVGQRGSL